MSRQSNLETRCHRPELDSSCFGRDLHVQHLSALIGDELASRNDRARERDGSRHAYIRSSDAVELLQLSARRCGTVRGHEWARAVEWTKVKLVHNAIEEQEQS